MADRECMPVRDSLRAGPPPCVGRRRLAPRISEDYLRELRVQEEDRSRSSLQPYDESISRQANKEQSEQPIVLCGGESPPRFMEDIGEGVTAKKPCMQVRERIESAKDDMAYE